MDNTALLVFLFLVASSFAFPFGGNQVEGFQRFKNLLPKDLVDAYSNLSPEERKDMREVFRNYQNYRNDQEFMAAIKRRNPSLGTRIERKMFDLRRKVAGLSEESREFIGNLIATGKQVYAQRLSGQQLDRAEMRQIGMGVASHYRSLSPFAQTELHANFPEIFQFLQQVRSQGFRGMLQGFFDGGGIGR